MARLCLAKLALKQFRPQSSPWSTAVDAAGGGRDLRHLLYSVISDQVQGSLTTGLSGPPFAFAGQTGVAASALRGPSCGAAAASAAGAHSV